MAAITAILYREGKIRATNITFMLWDLGFPLFYLLFFGVGMTAAVGAAPGTHGLNYNAFFLAGVLGMATFVIASNSSWSFFLDRDNGIFYEMLTYPMSRAEYLLGKLLFNVFVGIVQAAITLTLGSELLHVPVRWDLFPLLLAGIVGGTAGWFYFYAIFSLRIRRNDIFNSVNSVLFMILIFASSMFYPVDVLPRWFRDAALANPITWEVDFLRLTSIGQGDPRRVAMEAAAFAVFAIASFLLAVRALQEQE